MFSTAGALKFYALDEILSTLVLFNSLSLSLSCLATLGCIHG